MNLDALRARLTPRTDEVDMVNAKVARLVAHCQGVLDAEGIDATASVQGSIAKGTWLAGGADVDLFLLVEQGSDEDLEQLATRIGDQVLENPRRKYAQHPYVIGVFEELDVDMVPAYRVEAAHENMSAVDRTPFHTQWVAEHLDDAQRADVRLLKQWCKGVGVYGAETAIGGFSGYLLEVLVQRLGSFHAVMDWLAADATPRRIAGDGDAVKDEVSPLVVVDPVDAGRNCAAAVQDATLARAVEAARAWADGPSARFLFPDPVTPMSPPDLTRELRSQGAVWVGLELHPRTDRLDIVLPQFQRTHRMLCEAFERAGFKVRRGRVDSRDDPSWVGMQWVLDGRPLPAKQERLGPSPEKAANATKFRKKWDGHADAVGPVEERDGRLAVVLHVRERTPDAWLAKFLDGAEVPKHVAAALPTAKVHKVPAVPSPWAPAVTQFILGKPPWRP